MSTAEDILKRRTYFPRGLSQPTDGYRFSIDALLLASFASPPEHACGLDLGTGCGVVSLALLLSQTTPNLHLTGLDLQPEMIQRAQANALLLGFESQTDFILEDISSYRQQENSLDFVVANPPYRRPGQGRLSPTPGRMTARFEDQADIHAFARAATRALKDKAPFYLVHLPERLPEVLKACASATLEPKRLRFVHSREDEPARIMLLEARKNCGTGLVVDPPLTLYKGRGEATELSEAALAFCPFLQCNAKTE
ncbi:MAG: methyltransferase domain-containing protein [Proteobacteria bacterium]|nr:methyltransferase domain-containing protein [Pseudomonadota bacterium]MBU1612017.1 methyltransferase domain-containing protein [Pseudomonadota bacterium]